MSKSSFVIAALAALVAGSASAQLPVPVALEIRGGIPFPTGSFGETRSLGGDLEAGYSLGANATVQFTRTLGIYGGYSYNSFGVDGSDADVTDQGIDAGLRAVFPTTTGLAPFLKGGLVYHQLERSGGGVNFAAESDRELGFEVGGGIEIPLGRTISFTPGVSYIRYDTDAFLSDGEVSYVRADMGLRFRL